jgi:hypothetical protein
MTSAGAGIDSALAGGAFFRASAEARQGDMVGRQKAPRGKSADTTG